MTSIMLSLILLASVTTRAATHSGEVDAFATTSARAADSGCAERLARLETRERLRADAEAALRQTLSPAEPARWSLILRPVWSTVYPDGDGFFVFDVLDHQRDRSSFMTVYLEKNRIGGVVRHVPYDDREDVSPSVDHRLENLAVSEFLSKTRIPVADVRGFVRRLAREDGMLIADVTVSARSQDTHAELESYHVVRIDAEGNASIRGHR